MDEDRSKSKSLVGFKGRKYQKGRCNQRTRVKTNGGSKTVVKSRVLSSKVTNEDNTLYLTTVYRFSREVSFLLIVT